MEHSEAQLYCNNIEGKLAEPESKVEVEILVELFGDDKSFWVGVSDKNGRGRYKKAILYRIYRIIKWGIFVV